MLMPSKCTLRLVPFLVTAVIYILHFDNLSQSVLETAKISHPTVLTAVLKCLPILCLIGFVAAHEETAPVVNKTKMQSKASIAVGLMLGCVGDACLVFEQTFVLGMLAFAAGHCFYIYARGFRPMRLVLGIAIFAICTLGLIIVRDKVPDPVVRDAMPFYSLILVVMCWRSIAVVNESIWSKIGAIGGVLFVVSDFCLVLQFELDLPYGELIVMTTYYGSQMCTALSVLDSTGLKQE